jgi:protein-S-isoprenylcysteine O-methyltransferase Ste14
MMKDLPPAQDHTRKPWSFRKWVKATSNRTFILYPVIVILLELLIRKGSLVIVAWGLLLLPWGYLQFRWCGTYRSRLGGGGPGYDIPPQRIVDTGIYAYTRNPMYLGHILFIAGLAISFASVPAAILLGYHLAWFHQRVLNDEERLKTLFGQEYVRYMARVKRWVPGLF